MKFEAFLLKGHGIGIRPAPVERPWMDATDQRFAYRCLPLNIANAHGWEILCPSGFTACWNGDRRADGVTVAADDGTTAPALGHFGHGVLTFHIPCVFRTEPGWDLMVMGPVNQPKDAIAALTGVIETDWAPVSFTMNWRFTRADTPIRFEAGEPFAHVFPVQRGALEQVRPVLRPLQAEPELQAAFEAWSESRARFNDELRQPGTPAGEAKWQKSYYQGRMAGAANPQDHRTRLRLAPFRVVGKGAEGDT